MEEISYHSIFAVLCLYYYLSKKIAHGSKLLEKSVNYLFPNKSISEQRLIKGKTIKWLTTLLCEVNNYIIGCSLLCFICYYLTILPVFCIFFILQVFKYKSVVRGVVARSSGSLPV